MNRQELIQMYYEAGLPIEQAISKACKDLREKEVIYRDCQLERETKETLEDIEDYQKHVNCGACDWRG